MKQNTNKLSYQAPSIEIVTTKSQTLMLSALELYYLKMYTRGDDNEDVDEYDLF